jgi:hypothetical protein
MNNFNNNILNDKPAIEEISDNNIFTCVNLPKNHPLLYKSSIYQLSIYDIFPNTEVNKQYQSHLGIDDALFCHTKNAYRHQMPVKPQLIINSNVNQYNLFDKNKTQNNNVNINSNKYIYPNDLSDEEKSRIINKVNRDEQIYLSFNSLNPKKISNYKKMQNNEIRPNENNKTNFYWIHNQEKHKVFKKKKLVFYGYENIKNKKY